MPDTAHASRSMSDVMVRVVAENRGPELLEALCNAVAGAPRWRPEAQALLRSIGNLELSEEARQRLRERDDSKRRAEQMDDIAVSYGPEREDDT